MSTIIFKFFAKFFNLFKKRFGAENPRRKYAQYYFLCLLIKLSMRFSASLMFSIEDA